MRKPNDDVQREDRFKPEFKHRSIPGLKEVKAHESEADAVDMPSMRKPNGDVQRKDRFKPGMDLCLTCQHSLIYLNPLASCPSCALPITEGSPCGQCLKCPRHFDECRAAVAYTPEVARLIIYLKFQARLEASKILSSLCISMLQQFPEPYPEVLIPMPLHRYKLWRRGFNQSILISEYLSKSLQIPLDRTLLFRQLTRQPQSELSFKERQSLSLKTFRARPNSYQSVALIDDVMTSGATANAAAYALKQSGVQKVYVWCVARALPD